MNPFQAKLKTPDKKNNKSLQQSLLPNDTDNTSDDEEHVYTRIQKHDSSFSTNTTLQQETYSNIKKSMSNTPQDCASAVNVKTNSKSNTPYSQIIPVYDNSFSKYKNYY